MSAIDQMTLDQKAKIPLQLSSKERVIYYYGVEQVGWKDFGGEPMPYYTKGVWMVRVGPWDDERQLREIIEARCRSNPNGAFLGHLIPGGFPTPFFQWIN
jgi:hypothetical protein